MNIKKVTDPEFRKYGRILKDIDLTSLIEALQTKTQVTDEVVYEPSVKALEDTAAFSELQTKVYGELPIQIGFCNGQNHQLNALEYHRSSEINAAARDAVLLVGMQQDITEEYTYDTANVEGFFLPAGMAVELYATTLHYAPCSADEGGFCMGIVLPKDTNLPLDDEHGCGDGEDRLLFAKNKWLIGHPDAGLVEGAHIGLVGENIKLR